MYVFNAIAALLVFLLLVFGCAKAYLALSRRYNIWYFFNAKPFRKRP